MNTIFVYFLFLKNFIMFILLLQLPLLRFVGSLKLKITTQICKASSFEDYLFSTVVGKYLLSLNLSSSSL